MINLEKYESEFIKVLKDLYPNGNYSKYQLSLPGNKVRLAMDRYVNSVYGDYYKDEIKQLIDEKEHIYKICVENLGI